MENTIGILVYPRWVKASKNGKAPIMGRITINGKRAEIPLHHKLHPDKWDGNKARAKGGSEEARMINRAIDQFILKSHKFYDSLNEQGMFITSQLIKSYLLGQNNKNYTFVEVFKKHIKELDERIGIDICAKTFIKYKTSCKHLQDYLQENYNKNDIYLKELKYEFITGFEHFMKTKKNNGQNSTYKHIQRLRKVVNIAVANEWIDRDPFMRFSMKTTPSKPKSLTSEELQAIEDKQIHIDRLNQIRHVFLFSCYTGIAFTDISNLSPDDITKGIDGELWIKGCRQKSSVEYNVPILPQAMRIIQLYKDHPKAIANNCLFPVPSNQKTNAYLKEIADICGINKNLTFHMARHTFATTVTLTNGVPIETVSKMLGHTSIKTTQIYSRVVEKKVSADMLLLKEKLAG